MDTGIRCVSIVLCFESVLLCRDMIGNARDAGREGGRNRTSPQARRDRVLFLGAVQGGI